MSSQRPTSVLSKNAGRRSGDELERRLAALERLRGNVGDDDGRPLAGKHDGNRAADSGARPGDDSHLARK